MIVLSTTLFDSSSSDVIDWLGNSKVLRINNDDVPKIFLEMDLKIEFNNHLPNIKSVWYRKGGYTKLISGENQEICKYATQELYALSHFFYGKNSEVKTLGTAEFLSLSKLSILSIFNDCGLETPPTLVTTMKQDLAKFKEQHGDIIIKSLSDGVRFQRSNRNYKIYTEELSESSMANLNEKFFPTLVQKKIDRNFEIRSFYLNGKFYSMAIFITEKINLEVDYRIHMQRKGLRMIPYQLPNEVESKMRNVMKKLSLDTGSFDIIKALDGKYYFLELNPSGQFGALSEVCNYYIEKSIAKYLLNEN